MIPKIPGRHLVQANYLLFVLGNCGFMHINFKENVFNLIKYIYFKCTVLRDNVKYLKWLNILSNRINDYIPGKV